MNQVRKRHRLSTIVLTIVWLALTSQQADANAPQFRALLTEEDGKEVIRAEAFFEADEKELIVHYHLEILKGISNITMAHLHVGAPGEIGSPVVWLYPSSPPPRLIPEPFEGMLAAGSIRSRDLIGPLRGQPISVLIYEMKRGNLYVNLHTLQHPESEVKGRVLPVEP